MEYAQRRTEHARGRDADERDADGTALAFAAFVLAHAGCYDGPGESRLDGGSLACWCARCDVLRIFGPGEEAAR